MPEIRPFDAWQYQTGVAGDWETLCCPPYDVISEAAQNVLETANPYNCIRLERPLGDQPYKNAAALLDKWRSDGVLARAGGEAYYVYEMIFESGGKSYTLRGFTGRCALTPFSGGQVLPHEETLSKAKADRMELMLATKCNFSSIYMLYSDPDGVIPAILSDTVKSGRPHADFTMDGVRHRMWRLDDAGHIARITAHMSGRSAFIADGHHRYETALAYREHTGAPDGHPASYVMATFVDLENPGLVVLPTHRVVYGCDPQAVSGFLDSVGDTFTVEECLPGQIPALLSQRQGAVAFYRDGKAALLTLRNPEHMKRRLPDAGAAYLKLDVAVLHELILEPHFGIDQAALAKQQNLTYTRDMNEAMMLTDTGKGQCAFLMSPTPVPQIRDVSLEGGKMPQKSTYFYPKLITGLYINGLSE